MSSQRPRWERSQARPDPIVVSAPPTEPAMPPVEATAWIRKRLLDQLTDALDRFVIAMRAEGVSDETAARVLNRITLGVPDPDEVITLAEPSAATRHLCGDAQKLDPWGQHGGPTCH